MIGGAVARHTVTIRRAPVRVERGNEVFDWAAAVDSSSAGWAVDESGSSEDEAHRNGASVSYVVRGPFDADVRHTDRVVLFGDVFVIAGGVRRQPGPTALTSHTVLTLTVWVG